MLAFCAMAWAQDTASITGTITDPSGAAVPNAQVTVARMRNTELIATAPATVAAIFSSARCPSVPTILTVTAEGFKKYEAKGIVLVIAQKARVNVSAGSWHHQH